MIRSVESVALHVLRSLEDQLLKGVTHHLCVRTPAEVALYILNQKRSHLVDLETRFMLHIAVIADAMVNGQHYVLERGDLIERDLLAAPPIVQPHTVQPVIEAEPEEIYPDEVEDEDDDESVSGSEEDNKGKRRRRRRRRKPSNGDAARAEGGEFHV